MLNMNLRTFCTDIFIHFKPFQTFKTKYSVDGLHSGEYRFPIVSLITTANLMVSSQVSLSPIIKFSLVVDISNQTTNQDKKQKQINIKVVYDDIAG